MDTTPLPTLASPPLGKFEPHITLGTVPSDTPVELLRQAIPADTQPLTVKFSRAESQDTFFRSAIVHCERTSELDSLLLTVKSSLEGPGGDALKGGVKVQAIDFPHVSLYYIDDERAEQRKPALEQMFEDGTLVQEEDGLAIRLGGEGKEDLVRGFVAEEIWVALCDGPLDEWKVLEKISLTGQR